MKRKEAEKLLAALIFDDLDEASKTKLLTYLQSDDELRERLADMRMAVKMTSDTVRHGPEPVLGKRRLKRLTKLARRHRSQPTIFTVPRLAAAAAIFIIAALVLINMQGSKVRPYASQVRTKYYEQTIDDGRGIEVAGRLSHSESPADTPLLSKQATEITSARGQYAYDPVAQSPVDTGGGTIVTGPISNNGRLFVKDDIGGITGAQTHLFRGGVPSSGKPGPADKRTSATPTSAISLESKPPSGMRKGGGSGGMGGMGGGYGGMGLDGDGTAASGRSIFFHNGKPAGIKIDGSTIDNVIAADDDGDRRPVDVVTRGPVASTKPELTLPSQPMSNVSGPSNLPNLTLPPGGTESHVVWQDAHTEWFRDSRRRETRNKNEAVFKELDEPDTKDYQDASEKAKPVVPPYGKVVDSGFQGNVSKEEEELLTHDGEVTPVTGTEKYVKELSELTGEIESLLEKAQTQSTGSDSLSSMGREVDKEENGRKKIPILGDIPITGGLFRFSRDGKKQPLSVEEKERIVKYLEGAISQPEGEPVEPGYETIQLKYANPREVEDFIENGIRQLPGTETLSKVLIAALPQSQQIIVFGRKDMREMVKKMAQEIDKQRPQVRLDSTFMPGGPVGDPNRILHGEDETDLPAALRFKLVPVNPWVMAERDSLSTFALDVDTASYTLCRRYIRGGFLPPAGAVRMEEFVNYFNYNYPQRTNPTFMVHAEAAASPFAGKDKNLTLLKIGVKARTIGRDQRKAAHLIFVVDASASMGQPDRLPFVQQALDLLVNKLSGVDRVSLITCANEARLHLEATPARERDRIRQAIYAIQSAGSTNLLAGLKLGYATARRSFAPKQINHVVLCSDGVANVGQTEADAVLEEVAADRKQGITITCVGVGYGSYNDAFLEALANRGDGSYVFLDSARQAQQVFVKQLAATLQTVAKDARIQVNFNPHRVRRYRLIGYENRDIEDKRFRDDTIDAGEVGSGQCSTALYELELIGQPSVDRQGDLGIVFVRYRDVETGQIEEISSRLSSAVVRRHTVASAPRFFLAAGAARFAEILRQSEHTQHGNLTDVLRVAEQVSLALPLDRDVRELVELIRKAEHLPRAP